MYGLINQAVKDLITQNYGEESWEEIKNLANVDIEEFVGMSTYPDSMTYQLVGAASQKLGLSQEEILVAFGEYWILFTAEKGYGPILSAAGDNFLEFLQNLNQLHSRIQTMMPELEPPRFECTDITDHSLRFHYHSNRPGLSDLVMGLLNGLGKRFQVSLKVNKEAPLPESKSTVFFINFESE
jgi:hypothetical protein